MQTIDEARDYYAFESSFELESGLEVIVMVNIGKAEPDVGIMGDYIDDMIVFTLDGQEIEVEGSDKEYCEQRMFNVYQSAVDNSF